MPVSLITTPQHAQHTHPQHPEHAGRIDAVMRLLAQFPIAGVTVHPVHPMDVAVIHAVHAARYVASLQQLSQQRATHAHMDADTYVTGGSYAAACDAAFAACQAVDAMMTGTPAMSLGRPPGHHAVRDQYMGFCFFNNVAIATRYLQHTYGIKRVAVVDIDVHHGNGTNDYFYADADVLFVSSHASPLCPFSGARDAMVRDSGHGSTLNIPLPNGSGDRFWSLPDTMRIGMIPLAVVHCRSPGIPPSCGHFGIPHNSSVRDAWQLYSKVAITLMRWQQGYTPR